jgi:hypothetical protein
MPFEPLSPSSGLSEKAKTHFVIRFPWRPGFKFSIGNGSTVLPFSLCWGQTRYFDAKQIFHWDGSNRFPWGQIKCSSVPQFWNSATFGTLGQVQYCEAKRLAEPAKKGDRSNVSVEFVELSEAQARIEGQLGM